MTSFIRAASRLVARASLAAVLLSFAAFTAWTAGDLLGQPPPQKKPRVEEEEETPKAKKPAKKPRVEEEETPRTKTPGKKKHVEEEEESPRKKPKRKVIRVEEDEDPKAKSTPNRPNTSAASGDLNQLAEQATHPAVKKLFLALAVPHDYVVFKRTPGVTVNGERTQLTENVEPIALYLGNNPSRYRRERIRFTPLTRDWQRGRPFEPNLDRLELVQPYELIAQDKVNRFLKAVSDPEDSDAPHSLSRYDKLIVAEQALSAVLRWHESARQTGKRSGEEWASVEKSLRKQLLDDVLLEEMKVLAQTKDWDHVLELAQRLAITYPDPVERQRIFRPVADMIRAALRDPTGSEEKKQLARERLRKLERQYPGSPAFQPLGDTLRGEAEGLLKAGRAAWANKNEPLARVYLLKAQKTWPELPELRAFEIELDREHPTLHVGVRGLLPRYFSPAWACTENEHRAVDLLFESLVKLIPDEAGGFRYRPALSESRPKVVPLGRQFELPRDALWSNKKTINSTDVDFSLRSLRNGWGVGRSRVWGDLLDACETRNPFRVTLRLKQGFLAPLALMTFKVLPSGQEVNTEEFAQHPITSGPFLLDLARQSDEFNRPCLFFKANPYYGLRPTKRDTPHIQEIRFYTYTDAVKELASGKLEGVKLDLVLDLTAEEAQTLEKQYEVPKPSPKVPNRRIYFLAINNRKIPDARLRRALAFAIDRESLLTKHFRVGLNAWFVPTWAFAGLNRHFRAGLEELHRPLNGPFPAGSWVCKRKGSDPANKADLDLYDADRAKNLSVGVEKPAGLKLKYPQGQPALDEAMKELSEQVKSLTGVVLEPVACDPYQLRKAVEQRHDYDVAYYHYDFPDESYWLAPLLGPPSRVDGNKNIFNFANAKITNIVNEAECYRDFTMVREYQWTLHKMLRDEMPFIPLWQLDPLLAYRREVRPAALDAQRVFRNIEDWRLRQRR